jgi:hypothetical protein
VGIFDFKSILSAGIFQHAITSQQGKFQYQYPKNESVGMYISTTFSDSKGVPTKHIQTKGMGREEGRTV